MDLQSIDPVSDESFLVQLGLHVGVAAVTVADQHGVYDHLADGPSDAPALAFALGLVPQGVAALCPVLVAMEMLSANPDGTFELTPTARAYWVSSSPFYRGKVLGYRHAEHHQKRMAAALTAGGGDDPITPMWEAGEVGEEAAQLFTEIMHELSLAPSLAAVRSGAFDAVTHVIDTGGGSGAFCAAFASAYPERRTTLFELPPICTQAKKYVSAYDNTEGVTYYAADFFRDPWPVDGDAYFFGNVLHGWNPPTVRDLLNNCHAALPEGGRIFIHEILLDSDHVGPPVAAYFNMMMFLTHGSRQYSFADIAGFLTEAGFADVRVANRFGAYTLIEATRN